MQTARYSLLVSAAMLIDGGLFEEKKKWARELADEIFESLADMFYEDFERDAVIERQEIEYSAEDLPRVATATLAALTPPMGEGKRRCVLLVFHGEDGSVAADTAVALEELLRKNGQWLGRTRIFVFSEAEELVGRINDVCYMGLWGVPERELCDKIAEDVAAMIYHNAM